MNRASKKSSDDEEYQYQLDLALAESLSLAESKKDPIQGMSAAEKAFFTDMPIGDCKAGPQPVKPAPEKAGSLLSRLAAKPAAKAVSSPICPACRKPCTESHLVRYKDTVYHPACFICAACHKPIDSQFISKGSPLKHFHVPCAQTAFPQKTCPRCLTACGTGQHVVYNESTYHPHCFTCAGCSRPIAGPFSLHSPPSGTGSTDSLLLPDGTAPYHADCARELFNPRCRLCADVLSGQYLRHPFFPDELYCLKHKEAAACFSCSRRESKQRPFVDLLDGRSVCGTCSESVIMDSKDAAMLFGEVCAFLCSLLGPLPEGLTDVPILAVDVYSLNEQIASTHHCGNCPIVRGCTLSTQRTTIRHLGINSLQYTPGRGIFGYHPAQHVTTTREVTAILLLFGMPRDLAGSVLAHEAMHAYIKLSHSAFPIELTPAAEEGICQLIGDHYLAALGPGEDRAYYQHAIATDPSPIYGDGFRTARAAEEVLGLRMLLEQVGLLGKLPEI